MRPLLMLACLLAALLSAEAGAASLAWADDHDEEWRFPTPRKTRGPQGEPIWPTNPAGPYPGLESPWDHPKGTLFPITTKTVFFRRPEDLGFKLNCLLPHGYTYYSLSSLVDNKNTFLLDPGRVVKAVSDIANGEGLVEDSEYGIGYILACRGDLEPIYHF